MKIAANFERVRRALYRQGEGDRVPLFELSVHSSIKAKVLGRPIQSLADEIDFWRTAGYDFVPMRAGVRSLVRGLHPAVKEWRQARSQGSPTSPNESWVNKESGLVGTPQDFAEIALART